MTVVRFDSHIEAFLADIDASAAALGRENDADAQHFADLAVDRMRQYVPVDTGRLRASLGSRDGHDDKGFYVDAGSFDVEYNGYVEFGTSKMAEQPYVRPGVAEAIVQWLSESER